MASSQASSLAELQQMAPREAADVAAVVSRLLRTAAAVRASDLHLLPVREGLQISWRRDGMLQTVGLWPAAFAANVVARLKVLADLLTYRTDLPQEGRLRGHDSWPGFSQMEMRLSTFPTLHGEKAVIRLFVGSGDYQRLDDLGMPANDLHQLKTLLQDTSGCLVLSGPAGSGKTTTAYACLREIIERHEGRAVATLEDPIEAELAGASQTQVHRPAEFTYGLGLRSLMRQDPDVIFVGEVRDAETAATSFQASLTGHLVLTTLHAGSAGQAVTRLRDLGVEPYLLRAGLRGIACQRLLRNVCLCQAQSSHEPQECPRCWGTGYHGRLLISELLTAEMLTGASVNLETLSGHSLQQLAIQAGLRDLMTQAGDVVQQGRTTAAEVWRVLGALPAANQRPS